LSKHRYGCRVVQRVIEYCVEKQKEAVLEVIISCVQNEKSIVEDQYGNYVIQQTIVCGKEEHQAAILEALIADGAFSRLCKHKYASNVVEGMLKRGSMVNKELIAKELLKVSKFVQCWCTLMASRKQTYELPLFLMSGFG
jgi:pumilio RNA-binding family